MLFHRSIGSHRRISKIVQSIDILQDGILMFQLSYARSAASRRTAPGTYGNLSCCSVLAPRRDQESSAKQSVDCAVLVFEVVPTFFAWKLFCIIIIMLPLLWIDIYTPIPHASDVHVRKTLGVAEDEDTEENTVDESDWRSLLQLRINNRLEEYAGGLWKLLSQSSDLKLMPSLQWEGGDRQLETTSLRRELDVCLWTLAAQKVAEIGDSPPNSKLEWNAASQRLQAAASFLHHIQQDDPQEQLFDASLYELLMIAEGQRCVYQAFACQQRPKHFLLAKLCMTVANVYNVLDEEYELDGIIAEAVRAWGMFLSALAEYHQAQVDQGSAAAARMENCRKFASFCKDFLETCEIEIPELVSFTEQIDEIPVDPDLVDELFDLDELPEILPQPSVIKINTNLESLLKVPDHLFRAVKTEFLTLLNQFEQSLHSKALQASRMAEQKTETARSALQSVHLPQSISNYTNAEHRLETNHDTTELHRSSESAWEIVARVDQMVDTRMGGEIQNTFQKTISQYKTLLEQAAASDSALRDRPLPDIPSKTPDIVTELSQSLAQLSLLFRERESAVQKLHQHVKDLHLKTAVRRCDTEADVRKLLDQAQQTFEETYVKEIERNVEQQAKLLYQIMQENDRFQRDEDLAMIEDAVIQHDRFERHLQQGLDFYKSILPKLEKLERQMVEVCDRLSEERTVDDEKVANLVAMDFEFEKVVKALRKHDNNFEQALNDLLSC